MRSMFTIAGLVVIVTCAVAMADHDITVPYEAPEGTAVIDGDLSDWADATWIQLDEVYSPTPADVSSAKYALRWNDAENVLCFAVEMVDTEHVMVPAYVTWNAHDDVEISVDAGNNELYFGSLMTEGQQIVFGASGTGSDWVIASWGNVVGTDLVPEYVVAVNGDVISYEGKIVPFSYYAVWIDDGSTSVEVDLAPGVELGFDVVGVTALNDASYGMLANNLTGGKFQQGASLQSWTLVSGGTTLQADFDGDGDVDLDDFVILKTNFGVVPPANGDADGDGDVDLDDFVILKNEFGS